MPSMSRKGEERGRASISGVLLVLGWALFSGTFPVSAAGAEKGAGAATGLKMNLAPAPEVDDPGPDRIIGAAKTAKGLQGGTPFVWVDVTVDGGSADYRVYLDRVDNDDYHFLDRKGALLTLGLREGGVEQILSEARLPAGEAARPIRVARHGALLGVFHGSALLMSAFDDRRLGGTVGVRNRQAERSLNAAASARDEIHFADDFMRKPNTSSVWRKLGCGPGKGDFSIKALRHPLLSANPFNYMGAGKGVRSVTGEPWWDSYRFEAALRGPQKARIGLLFAFHDEKNYGLFRWSARPVRPDGSPSGKGLCELLRVHDGQETVVGRTPIGYLPDQWYRAEVLLTYERVRLSIDGHALLEVHDPYLASGGVGLWCDVPLPSRPALDPKAKPFRDNSLQGLLQQHAVFDDVEVHSLENFEDDFRRAGPLRRGWLVGTGDWTVAAPEKGQPGHLEVRPGAWASKSLIGSRRWGQYRLACDLDPGAGVAGLVFLYRDESNYFLARTDGQTLELLKVAPGKDGKIKEERIDSARLKLPPDARKDGFLRVSSTVKHGHIRVLASGGASVEGFEPAGFLRGRAGLWASGGQAQRPNRFRRFRLAFLEESEPLVTSNAIFEDESSMRSWTNPSEEWLKPRTPLRIDGQITNLLWHSSQFPGDVELVIEPREILEKRHEVALAVSKDGRGRNNGYVFKYQAGRQSKEGKRFTLLSLIRQGETVKEKVLPEGEVRELSTVSLRRAGQYVIGKVNGRPVLVYRDRKPLSGSKVAYYTKGLLAKTEASKIISRQFHNELFSGAPVFWRTAGYAIAGVANRWQCDPRWSFFFLKNDRRLGKPAVLWSKRNFSGDVTAEFFVGNKMETERGKPYTYARDINVTICSDGHDLTQGYSFLFGGFGNKGSMILRNGVEVKRSTRTIPNDMRYHRHWFYIRVEKRGGRLSFRVDRYFAGEPEGELVYEDPKPLSGGQVAIWTYDHAIMISRIRLSGDGGTTLEDPGRKLPVLKTFYDR